MIRKHEGQLTRTMKYLVVRHDLKLRMEQALTDRLAVDACKAHHDVLGVVGHDLKELALVNHLHRSN